MIEPIQKSNHIITNHVVNRQSNNTAFGLHGIGFFNDGLTTIRRKRTRKVPYNQIEGGLAHCTIFHKHNNRLTSDESVINGGIYQLRRFGEYVFLVPVMIPQASLPITPQPAFTRPKSTRRSTHRPKTISPVPIPTQQVRNLFQAVEYEITSVPSTPLPIFTTTLPTLTRMKSTPRPTRRPVTTSSVKTTTRQKELKRFSFSIPLQSKRYGCKWIWETCKYTKPYSKVLQDVQGN